MVSATPFCFPRNAMKLTLQKAQDHHRRGLGTADIELAEQETTRRSAADNWHDIYQKSNGVKWDFGPLCL
jgi:hypothetical protein